MKRCLLRTGNAFSNVPGIALYMTGLNQVRGFMAVSPLFAAVRKRDLERHSSVLPMLTNTGNLLAGATTRVAVGFVLNPVSVLKARYEVSTFFAPLYAFLTSAHLLLFLSQSNLHAYGSLISSVRSITRGGPSELFRGFLASSLRDAPYAGLFLVFYEEIKHEAATKLPPSSPLASALLHSGSGASAGTVATLATHPFDVIKACHLFFFFLPFRVPNRPECKSEPNKNIMASRGQSWLCGMSVSLFYRLQPPDLCLYRRNGAYMVSSLVLPSASLKILSSAIGWAAYESLLVFARTRNGQRRSLYS